MAAQKKSAPRNKPVAVAAIYPTSVAVIATRNLINMTVVMASSATVLLALMIVRKF